MKLVASLIVRNEADRYLEPCLAHLLDFCDEVAVLDDGSMDGSATLAQSFGARVHVLRSDTSSFYEHEGRARQALLDWTFYHDPTHVLAIDADEFVTDGQAVRAACDDSVRDVWTLEMEEVWELDGDCICIREDGGWRSHPVPILYRVPGARGLDIWRIDDKPLACGREPLAVRRLAARSRPTGASVLHFGWANEAEREDRWHRYAVADGGRYHRSTHLDSILWTDERVHLRARGWPPELHGLRGRLTARVSRTAASERL